MPRSCARTPAWPFDVQDLPCNRDNLTFGPVTLSPPVFCGVLTAQTLTTSLHTHTQTHTTTSLEQELTFLAPSLGLSLLQYLAVIVIPEPSLVLACLWHCPWICCLPNGCRKAATENSYRKSSVPLTIKDFAFSKHDSHMQTNFQTVKY